VAFRGNAITAPDVVHHCTNKNLSSVVYEGEACPLENGVDAFVSGIVKADKRDTRSPQAQRKIDVLYTV